MFAGGVLVAQNTSGAKPKPATKKSAAKRKTTSKAGSQATSRIVAKTPVKTAAHRHSSGAKTTSKSKKPVATARRSSQREPTPERYKEIQQALADKGYFRGEADGTWGPESVDALRRFQREQNLTEDGKLGSLSLIAMGLGPKRPEPVVEKPAQR
jgi:peptidoglycan hydrolase-like protein with peptidoglycan-binding domain